MKIFQKTFLFLLTFLCLPVLASAQAGPTGTFSGTVTDPQGAIVSGAAVIIKNIATNQTRTTTTNEDGRYSFQTERRRCQLRTRAFLRQTSPTSFGSDTFH
jgi:hypothetical protein